MNLKACQALPSTPLCSCWSTLLFAARTVHQCSFATCVQALVGCCLQSRLKSAAPFVMPDFSHSTLSSAATSCTAPLAQQQGSKWPRSQPAADQTQCASMGTLSSFGALKGPGFEGCPCWAFGLSHPCFAPRCQDTAISRLLRPPQTQRRLWPHPGG